jgi:hypothetical protein
VNCRGRRRGFFDDGDEFLSCFLCLRHRISSHEHIELSSGFIL